MIRATLVDELYTRLGGATQEFDTNDFDITTGTRTAGKTKHGRVTIKCRFAPEYYFEAFVPTKRAQATADTFTGKMKPGIIVEDEGFQFASWTALTIAVESWAIRVRDELVAQPVLRELAEHREALDDILSSVGELKDGSFTEEEANELRQKLDDLESQLQEQLKKSEQNEKALEASLGELHRDVENLKQSLEVLNRKGWASKLMVRVAKWMTDPKLQPVLESGASIAKKLLTSGD